MQLGTKVPVRAALLSDTHLPHRMARLPTQLFDALDGVDVILHAGDVDRSGALDPLREIALERLYPWADVIVFGHTRRTYVRWIGGTLLVNPGAVAPTLRQRPPVARMWLGEGPPDVEIVYL